MATYTFNSQPFRNTGFTYLFASALLVKRRFLLSHSSLPGTRNAITPSSIHSAYGPGMLKLEQDGSPPLQYRTQSSMWPGDRVSNCGGRTQCVHLAAGRRRMAARSRELNSQHGRVGDRQLAFVLMPDQFHARGSAQLQREMHGAHRVDAPVADLAGPEIEKAPPVIGRVLGAIGPHGRIAQPKIPIQIFGNACFGWGLLTAGGMCAGGTGDVYFGNMADRAGP